MPSLITTARAECWTEARSSAASGVRVTLALGGLVLVESREDPGTDQCRRGEMLCIGGPLHPGLPIFTESARMYLGPVLIRGRPDLAVWEPAPTRAESGSGGDLSCVRPAPRPLRAGRSRGTHLWAW